METIILKSTEDIRVWGIHTMDDKLFLQDQIIAIGWKDMGDLSKIDSTINTFVRNTYIMKLFKMIFIGSQNLLQCSVKGKV